MFKGFLTLVLHTHLPFVRHPEKDDYLEERWFFEALTESYIPLLQVFEGLATDGVPFRLTMSLTPTLLTMFSDNLLQDRYVRFLDGLIELADKEVERTAEEPQMHSLADFYLRKFQEIREYFVVKVRRNLINGFKQYHDAGYIDFITCCATHAFTPLMLHDVALKAQIKTAVELHQDLFGAAPSGIWLPECGYRPGIEAVLEEFNLKYFFIDTHGVNHAVPKPSYGVYAPIYTENGVAAFGRDDLSAKQVWSSKEGYPGDYAYREYYRDIGYDLDFDYIKNYIHPSGIRINTGLKYYQITGKTPHKQPYDPELARERAALHASDFIHHRIEQIENLATAMERPPVIVAPYDTELFGHWWYEGPMFLDYLIRKLAYDQETIKLITPKDYLQLFPRGEVSKLANSTWGDKGYNEVWLNPANDWIYRHLHIAEERMIELASRHQAAEGVLKRALNQAARELLLAQSSDWAFIMKTGTMVDYAINRTKNHIGRFNRLYQQIDTGSIDEKWLNTVEWLDKIFPQLDYRVFRDANLIHSEFPYAYTAKPGRKVLMLSWEFPPKTIGGLARHVYDISRALAALGEEIHVLTCAVAGCPAYEVVEGVHVHRVNTFQENHLEFQQWILQLNIQMVQLAKQLHRKVNFELIHAHDWLVGHAAKQLKNRLGLPMVATIHATEHGRNQGIYTELQQHIHNLEGDLAAQAAQVICCSRYMQKEINQLFGVPVNKLEVIANGVDLANLTPSSLPLDERRKFAQDHEKTIFFVGRLVREKGVQVLIDAIPQVLAQVPNVRFLIAGKGPMLNQLQDMTYSLGVADKVNFLGFIDDETRNRLLRWSSVAVFPSIYEPFGIVALEGMAGNAPVVVSDTGGLSEIVEHGVDGFKVIPGDVHSLEIHLLALLKNEKIGREMAQTALHKLIHEYNWQLIAQKTQLVYQKVLQGFGCLQETC